MHCATLELYPIAPFNFNATLHKPDHFPSSDNGWEPGSRWQTMLWRGQALGLKIENRGSVEQPMILLSVYARDKLDDAFLNSLADEITYRYNLQLDLGDFYQRFGDDPHLGPVMRRFYGMRPVNFGSLYEYLMIAIVLQNATVRRSVNMLQTLFEHYGSQVSFDNKALSVFWQPETIHQASEADLRSLKVGYRAKSFLRVSRAFVEAEIDELALRSRPQEVQRQALLNLYGIGPASVWYILFDVFHHLDELNYISPWEQKIYSKLFFDRQPEDPAPVKELLNYFQQHFGGWRMLAVHYFWEDLFWRRKHEPVDWLEKLICL